MSKNIKKKSVILVLLISMLVVGGIMGTVAWLTATDTVTNQFTVVGDIKEPADPEAVPDPTPDDPTDDPVNPFDPAVDGYLWEPSWNEEDDHKLLPDATIPKDPYVGIGAGSEASTVYVYVHNNFNNKVYFTINSGWEAVEGSVTAGLANDTYTSGLFKYTAGLRGAESTDVWTSTPLFNNVKIDASAAVSDLDIENQSILVGSYIHQAADGEGQAVKIAADDIIEAITIEMGLNTEGE